MKKRIAIVLIGIIIVVVGRGFFYYQGSYSPPPAETINYENVTVALAPLSLAQFSDNPKTGDAVVLIDLAHRNDFSVDELNVLLLRLVSRGLSVRFFKAGEDLKVRLLGEEEEEPEPENEVNSDNESKKKEKEEEELPSAFIIVSPGLEFSKEERKNVKEFVDNGGKLLLIADPARDNEMDALALEFGLIFEPGYLYNQKENEINYQNIFLSEFKDNKVTEKLGKIALYSSGAISSADKGIIFTDNNTFSSVIATKGKLSPIALTGESKVLGVYDLTFMTEPYNGTLDNNQLIANIADWLMVAGAKTQPK